MRYEVHPSDDGRWFILDTLDQKVFTYCGNELLARKICRILNDDPNDNTYLSDIEDVNPPKLH